MERRMEEWEKSTKVGRERVEKGGGKRMKDRKQVELKKSRAKGESRRTERGEKEREEREDEERVKVGKEDGDKSDRDRMLEKVNRIWGEERWGVWMGREKGKLLKELVGLVGDRAEVLARTVGEGVRKMMKEREG